MGLINNIYVFVEEENVDRKTDTVSHPTESGMPRSDTVRVNPVEVSLSGIIVDTEKVTAEEAVNKIKALQNAGSLIKYVGKCGTISNLQIQTFPVRYNNKGAKFDMTLKEIKTAKSAYVKPKKVTSTKTTSKINVGNKVLFLGGNVYVSSDATIAAAVRGQSTCKLTIRAKNKRHPYHLISTDGRLVYGWVDENKVKAISSTTSTSSNGGTRQVQGVLKDVTYHTVKKGDTIYKLVNSTYKSKNLSVTEVIKNNPKCFAIKGKATTLMVGARLALY